METVGWVQRGCNQDATKMQPQCNTAATRLQRDDGAEEEEKPYNRIIFVNYIEWNVASQESCRKLSSAERSRIYRQKQKDAATGMQPECNQDAAAMKPKRSRSDSDSESDIRHPDARAREGEKKPEKPPEKPRRCEAVSKYSRPVRGAVGPEAVASVLGRLKTKLNPQPTDGARPNEQGSP
jgi:hypothetical protein